MAIMDSQGEQDDDKDFQQVFVLPSNARAWRAVLRCLREPDRPLPAPGDLSATVGALCAAVKVCGEDEERLARVLCAFLRQARDRLGGSAAQDHGAWGQDLAATVVLSCRLVDVRPGPRVALPDSSLLAEALPAPETKAEVEPVLEAILWELSRLGPDLGAEVIVAPSSGGEKGSLTFLQWLQQLAKYLSEQVLPVPVTPSAVSCLRALLAISPVTLEPSAGRLAATVLFNVDGVDPLPFWTELLHSFSKLRQVPKLVAKIFVSVTSDESEKDSLRTDSRCLSPFGSSVSSLSPAQVVDLWKTFLYHLATANEGPALSLLEFLLPCFLRHAPVVGFSVPRTSLGKFSALLKDTLGILADKDVGSLPSVRAAAGELSLALSHYRGLEFEAHNSSNVSAVIGSALR